MQIGYNVRKPKWHPLEALRAWLHLPERDAGRKCLHGHYPSCNWYPPTLPEPKEKEGASHV